MEPEEANMLLEKFEQEIRDFLKEKGYNLTVPSNSHSLTQFRPEIRAQKDEIRYIITIRAVKPYK